MLIYIDKMVTEDIFEHNDEWIELGDSKWTPLFEHLTSEAPFCFFAGIRQECSDELVLEAISTLYEEHTGTSARILSKAPPDHAKERYHFLNLVVDIPSILTTKRSALTGLFRCFTFASMYFAVSPERKSDHIKRIQSFGDRIPSHPEAFDDLYLLFKDQDNERFFLLTGEGLRRYEG